MVAPHGLRQGIRRADWQANCGRHTRTHQQRSRRCRTEPCRAKEKEPLSAQVRTSTVRSIPHLHPRHPRRPMCASCKPCRPQRLLSGHARHCAAASGAPYNAPQHHRVRPVPQILSGIISATDVPFSSYVAHPRTPLHYVDARLKQLWLLALLLLIPRLPWQARVSVVAGVLLLSVVCLPRRLCVEQLKRLLPLALLLTGLTALTADQVRGFCRGVLASDSQRCGCLVGWQLHCSAVGCLVQQP